LCDEKRILVCLLLGAVGGPQLGVGGTKPSHGKVGCGHWLGHPRCPTRH